MLALDPALPLINGALQIGRHSADHVQIFHTNAGYYGDIGPIGHSDICFNGGNIQPYCSESMSAVTYSISTCL